MGQVNAFALDGRVAVVTGGTQGLGEGFARALGDAGASVMLLGRDRERGETVARSLADHGVDAAYLAVDVTHPEEVAGALEETLGRFGRCDVLVNNAGACVHAPALEVTADDWRKVMAVNLDAVWTCSQTFGRHFVDATRRGDRQHRFDVWAHRQPARSGSPPTTPPRPPYITSPAASPPSGATFGVRVNALAPGYIKTDMSPVDEPRYRQNWIEDAPLRRYGTVEELAPAVVFLASDASSFITGSVLVADGGYTAF